MKGGGAGTLVIYHSFTEGMHTGDKRPPRVGDGPERFVTPTVMNPP